MSRQDSSRYRDDIKSGSSSRRSEWDDETEEKGKEIKRKDDKDGWERYSKRVTDDHHDERRRRSTDRWQKDDYRSRNYRPNLKDTKERKESRRRSTSPSTSSQFRRDRERERQSYDHKYGTSKEGSSDPTNTAELNLEPDFGSSGLLAKESNNKNGVQLKYFEPPEARKPKKKWRLYVFKDGKEIDIFHISRQSCYLIGRDVNVVDIPIDHQSISKQHAVIQFRTITQRNEFGDEKRQTKPFLIDLESANGTFVNKNELPPSRYYELRTGDTIKLGASQREYVLLAED